MNYFSKLALLGLALSLAACTVLDNDKINYKSAAKGPSLDVPPDLTQLSGGSRYAVPGAPVTASSFQLGKTSSSAPTSIPAKTLSSAFSNTGLVMMFLLGGLWITMVTGSLTL